MNNAKRVYIHLGGIHGTLPGCQDQEEWRKTHPYVAFEDEHGITLSKEKVNLGGHPQWGSQVIPNKNWRNPHQRTDK